MIVRDAEDALPRALESAKPFVDEMIVVDTGSVDNSKQIAIDQGAKVFDFPWCDDFARARNESLSHATGDWIFWMDADDVLVEQTGPRLRQLAAECPDKDQSYLVRVEEEAMTSSGVKRVAGSAQSRFFPNHPDIRFTYRVHEQVSPALAKLDIPIKLSEITVRHAHADRSEEGNHRRNERNLRLLKLDLEEHPDDAFVLLNIGMTHLYRPDELNLAIDYISRSIPLFPAKSTTRLNAFMQLATAYQWSNQPEKQLEACLQARDAFPDDAAILYQIGELSEKKGDIQQAALSYQDVLSKGRVHATVFQIRGVHGQAAIKLGRIYQRSGNSPAAESLWLQVLQRHPDALEVRLALTEYYITSQRPDDAERQLEQIPGDSPKMDCIRHALFGCSQILRENWDQAYNNIMYAHQRGYRSALSLHGLSVALLSLNRYAEAEPVLRELLQAVPNHPHARQNLELVRRSLGTTVGGFGPQ